MSDDVRIYNNGELVGTGSLQDKLNEALALAQADMPNATLNKTNPHFGSKYADLGSIREATKGPLSKHGLSLRQYTDIDADGKLILITKLAHKSGQEEVGRWPIERGRVQAMGSELTYGRRYNWAMMTGVAFEEDDDANTAEQVALKSKAQSREIFTTLIELMRDAKTQDELTLVIKEHYQMYAALNDDWKRDITKEGDRLRKILPQ